MAKKTKKDEAAVSHDGWEAMKSGGYKNGDWYASPYMTGWYFVSAGHENMGPFPSFDAGVVAWKKRK